MRYVVSGWAWAGVLALGLPGVAAADFKTDPPAAVCGYLEKVGLKVEGYKKIGDDLCFASTERPVGKAAAGSTIEYNVEGTQPTAVAKLFVNVKVAGAADDKPARAAFLAASEVLVEKATGKPLSPEMRKAVEGGTDGKWTVGGCTVEVSRIGKGEAHTLQILIK